jgi:hypothetical protein
MTILLTQVLTIVVLFGGPILPLLIIAAEVAHWHSEHGDPPESEWSAHD